MKTQGKRLKSGSKLRALCAVLTFYFCLFTFAFTAQAACPPGQFAAEYFNNITLSGSSVLSRCEAAINYDWGSAGPGGGVTVDNFSVRWIGTFTLAGGNYLFTARTDDGIRVWLDNDLIADSWRDQGPTTYTATRAIAPGDHQIKVEYYEKGGGAVAQVSWLRQAPSRPWSFVLAWQDMSDNELGFYVERCSGVNCASFQRVGTTAVNVQGLTDTIANDPGGATYCYRVQAYNAAAVSAYSNIVCGTSAPIAQGPTGTPGPTVVTLQLQ